MPTNAVASPTGREVLRARDLAVEVATRAGWRPVVRSVSLRLCSGEITALVGETGSGKTLTALSLIGLLPESARLRSGSIVLDGQELPVRSPTAMTRIRGRRIAMVFQDPATALNPVRSIGFQITEPMVTHLGLDRRKALVRAARLLDQLGLPDVERTLRRYPHELSGGMRQRALIAIALSCDPDVLLADEPTTALDVTVQAQVLDLIRTQVDERGLAVLLVTHNLGVAAQVAERVSVMYAGRVAESGPVEDVLTRPNHPYTRALVGCVPRVDMRLRPLPTLAGSIHGVWDLTAGCRFAPRCEYSIDVCRVSDPSLRVVIGGHTSACWVFAGDGEVAPQ